MENKPSNPTPGATSSQATGANKTASPASTPQSGSAAPQAQADRAKPSSTSSSAAPGSPQAAGSPAPDAASRASSPRPDQPQSQQKTADTDRSADKKDVAKPDGSQRPTWMNVSSWLDGTNQIPQSVKDLGTKATDQFNKLTTTQKVVGGALLVSGLSWLALRSKSQPNNRKPGYRSGTDYRGGQPYGSYTSGTTADQKFQGPYGNSPTRGISDDYPTKSSTSSTQYRDSDTAGFGDADYATDL